MSELMREIEEDIRRERFDKLWRDFGKIMVGASVAVVLATVGLVLWKGHTRTVAQERTAQMMQGLDRLDSKDYKAAIADFSVLAQDEKSPYYGMAMLRKAQAQAASGDKDGAAKSYAALARHNDTFGELAKLQVAGDALKPQLSSPFYFTQSEWNGWQALQQGKKPDAVAQFLTLRDNENTPASLQARMQETLQHIAPEKAADKGAAHE